MTPFAKGVWPPVLDTIERAVEDAAHDGRGTLLLIRADPALGERPAAGGRLRAVSRRRPAAELLVSGFDVPGYAARLRRPTARASRTRSCSSRRCRSGCRADARSSWRSPTSTLASARPLDRSLPAAVAAAAVARAAARGARDRVPLRRPRRRVRRCGRHRRAGAPRARGRRRARPLRARRGHRRARRRRRSGRQ